MVGEMTNQKGFLGADKTPRRNRMVERGVGETINHKGFLGADKTPRRTGEAGFWERTNQRGSLCWVKPQKNRKEVVALGNDQPEEGPWGR